MLRRSVSAVVSRVAVPASAGSTRNTTLVTFARRAAPSAFAGRSFASLSADILKPIDTFSVRHLGSNDGQIKDMLATVGEASIESLVSRTVPGTIRLQRTLGLGPERTESEVLAELKSIAEKNTVLKSFIGQGYYGTITPPVILRNILENPAWYTSYTPYQAEISQGRMESLINFQQMVQDLTGFGCANASLLDEATACAEAMLMVHRLVADESDGDAEERNLFFVSNKLHPQNISVLRTRAEPVGIQIMVGDPAEVMAPGKWSDRIFGAILSYPNTDGSIESHANFCKFAHDRKSLVIAATDLLSLTKLVPPAEFGADVAVGTAQRFGVPLNAGGPHAAFLATSEGYKRQIPGRIIGVSKDSRGKMAYRMALQTREQHIRREKATSNICTAMALLANVSAMYAVYHGPEGLRRIADRCHALALVLQQGLLENKIDAYPGEIFDTIAIRNVENAQRLANECEQRGYNIRVLSNSSVSISVDETTKEADIEILLEILTGGRQVRAADVFQRHRIGERQYSAELQRQSAFLTHPVFNTYHTEHDILRYMHRLQSKDISLATSMIPLGSCTMKLNATVEMVPVTWPEFANMHPYAPARQMAGYERLFVDLRRWLGEITGFPGISLQPISGASGEYAGLMTIRAFFAARGEIPQRKLCLIPTSAHGTNPASAVLAGFEVVAVQCDSEGNVDVGDVEAKVGKHGRQIACIMMTYPSTHGIFEENVRKICSLVHSVGAQVYMDGANMNAQVGLCRPGDIGADVCHLNLHKTFAIPHGGGGPPAAPIGVAEHLVPYLPGDPLMFSGMGAGLGAVSGTNTAVPAILPISWTYINCMGGTGLRKATSLAILNANYMAKRLEGHYPLVYRGTNGYVAHEFILDIRPFKESVGIGAEDIAKRLMDYGFHAPTMSFPIAGTLMIEPTESESKAELDRFCDAMIEIRNEIREVEEGRQDRNNNVLKNAPHTTADMALDDRSWNRPYGRDKAAFPLPYLRNFKFWPTVNRIDNVYGDRAFRCSCPPWDKSSM